ncbi:methyltransferase domain-containing protein [Kitasatospora sp. NPDC001574]
MTTVSLSAAEHRRTLADRLRAQGAITSPEIHAAFSDVPRDAFVGAFAVRTTEGLVRIDPNDPRRLSTIYSDESLQTQINEHGVSTSSSTLPTLMAVMLEALDLKTGDRVLEVATGTGYNAALLSHLVGAENVTTIEVDPELAVSAAERLDSAGYAPTVVVGDGREGHPAGAPYDRLIATCGFTHVPPAWLDQMAPGGSIVCPVGFGIVRLVVQVDGTAVGAFLPDPAYFMAVRTLDDHADTRFAPPAPADLSSQPIDLDPTVLSDSGFRFLLTLALPGFEIQFTHGSDGTITAAHTWHPDGSWAELRDGIGWQGGPRRLLNLADSALSTYRIHGQPTRRRFRLKVTPTEQWAWIEGTQGVRWRLA